MKNILSRIYPYRIIRDVLLSIALVGMGLYIAAETTKAVGVEVEDILQVTITNKSVMVILSFSFSIILAINHADRWLHLAIVAAILFTMGGIVTGFRLTTAYYYCGCYCVGGLLSMLYPVFRNREKIEGEAKNG